MLVDSDVLVYAINVASPKHKQAQEFLTDRQESLSVAHQNIFEALRVLTHHRFSNPMKPKSAVKSVLSIVRVLRIISPNYKTPHITTELIKKYNLTGNRVFDAYLAATTLSNEITTIATDNEKHFRKFIGIEILNPFK